MRVIRAQEEYPARRGASVHSRGRERGQGGGRADTEPELLCPHGLFKGNFECSIGALYSLELYST